MTATAWPGTAPGRGIGTPVPPTEEIDMSSRARLLRASSLRATSRRVVHAITARSSSGTARLDSTRSPSGRGGATGTPSADLDEAPPSLAQETNWVVSGGGLAGHDGRSPRRTRPSR